MTSRRTFTVRFATRVVRFEVAAHVCHNREKLAKLIKRGVVLRVLIPEHGNEPDRQAHLNLARVEEIV